MPELSKEVITRKIKGEEGDMQRPYKCPAGKWTIGAGINLEAQEMPFEIYEIWSVDEAGKYPRCQNGAMVNGLRLSEFGLPQAVRDRWLEIILETLTTQVENRLYNEYDISFGDLPEDCQIVVIDCCYQMGLDGFFAFKKTLGHIKKMDYVDASLELLDSKYFRDDTPERAQRNSDLLMGCGCKL